MNLRVKVDSFDVERSFRNFPNRLINELEIGVKKSLTLIQATARRTHRYTTRSGNLERSVQTKTLKTEIGGEVFLDTGIAIYGPAIHNGPRPGRKWGWKPDRFLNYAANKHRGDVTKILTDAVTSAILKAGLN